MITKTHTPEEVLSLPRRSPNSMIEKELAELTEDDIIIGDPVLKFWLKRIL